MPRQSNTVVEFFNVPWDSGYKNLRYFSSKSSRDSWFSSHYGREVVAPHITDGNTTEKRASPVKIGIPYRLNRNWDALNRYNYCRFINKGYVEGDWTYCFIDKIIPGQEHTCAVMLRQDAWMNNIDNIQMKPCLVERKHTIRDTVTYEAEPFGVNASVTKFNTSIASSSSVLTYILYATTDPEGKSPVYDEDFSEVDGEKQGLFVRVGDFLNMRLWINKFSDGGYLNNIITIIAYPSNYISTTGVNKARFSNPSPSGLSVTRDTGSYTPKNKKCLMYPYCYCIVSDKQKSSRVYKWEDGNGNGRLDFTLSGSVGVSGAMTLTPQFNDSDYQFLEDMSISLGYPMSYAGNAFANWMAQNQASIQAQQTSQNISTGMAIAGVAASIGATALTGGAAAPAMIASGANLAISQVASSMQTANSINSQVEGGKFASVPSQVPTGAMNFLTRTGRLGFTAYSVYPRKSEFQALDDCFTRFGYAYNRISNIDPTVRSSFAYYKTSGANVIGNAPLEERNVIADALDRGVTFWRNDNVGDYSQSNN